MEMNLKIDKKTEADQWILSLSGRLDTATSPLLKEEVDNCPENVTLLIMNLQELEYLSSAGLRELLAAHKKLDKQGGKMIVRNPREAVEEVFKITGFMKILNVED